MAFLKFTLLPCWRSIASFFHGFSYVEEPAFMGLSGLGLASDSEVNAIDPSVGRLVYLV